MGFRIPVRKATLFQQGGTAYAELLDLPTASEHGRQLSGVLHGASARPDSKGDTVTHTSHPDIRG